MSNEQTNKLDENDTNFSVCSAEMKLFTENASIKRSRFKSFKTREESLDEKFLNTESKNFQQ